MDPHALRILTDGSINTIRWHATGRAVRPHMMKGPPHMTDTQTVAGVFQEMEGKFKADKAAGIDATFQFDITGEDAAQYNAVIKDGAATFTEGVADNPTVTVIAGDQDWIRLVNGQLNPQMAFMTGKIKVKGDLALAMKLGQLFL
ncbi:MAG: dehydrogenase, short-chain alcohol dehydrogenase like protein [Thermoleophilia bacterium]|nr:dehydrogenase, short-chain alcohol dehydrogenase like protein [Thermoleophilia bacterium]MCZ4495791.1 dehydrogenase, short-chain alcohol dehydrogenase like protein [Thermoleophilia bacterium]